MTEMDNKNLAQESWVAEVFGVHALEVIFRVHALKAIPLEFNDVNGWLRLVRLKHHDILLLL